MSELSPNNFPHSHTHFQLHVNMDLHNAAQYIPAVVKESSAATQAGWGGQHTVDFSKESRYWSIKMCPDRPRYWLLQHRLKTSLIYIYIYTHIWLSFAPPPLLKPDLCPCTRYTIHSSSMQEWDYCVSLTSSEQSRGRGDEAPSVGIPILLVHRFSSPVAGYTNTNRRPPVSTLWAGCVGLRCQTQTVFSAAIRLLPSVAAWSPVRLCLRGAGGKMNTSHLGTLN